MALGASRARSSFFTWNSPGYFDTVDIPILSGRDFTERDTGIRAQALAGMARERLLAWIAGFFGVLAAGTVVSGLLSGAARTLLFGLEPTTRFECR